MAYIASVYKKQLIDLGNNLLKTQHPNGDVVCKDVVVLKTQSQVRFICCTNNADFVFYKTFVEIQQICGLFLADIIKENTRKKTNSLLQQYKPRTILRVFAVDRERTDDICIVLPDDTMTGLLRIRYTANDLKDLKLQVEKIEVDVEVKACLNSLYDAIVKRDTTQAKYKALVAECEKMSCKFQEADKAIMPIHNQLKAIVDNQRTTPVKQVKNIKETGYKKLLAIGLEEGKKYGGTCKCNKVCVNTQRYFVEFDCENKYGAFQIRLSFIELRKYYMYNIEPDLLCEKPLAIKITCYGKTDTWESRSEAMKFYMDCMCHSEGAERDRYTKIYIQLEQGSYDCKDTVDM